MLFLMAHGPLESCLVLLQLNTTLRLCLNNEQGLVMPKLQVPTPRLLITRLSQVSTLSWLLPGKLVLLQQIPLLALSLWRAQVVPKR